jgi:hypothetical protein
LRRDFILGGRIVTPHVSNPQDYDNHVETLIVQGNSKSGFEFKVFEFLFIVDQLAQLVIFDNLLESN